MDEPDIPSDSPPKARQPRRNADYRWTVPKVSAFLRALSECGSVAEAARSVGMSRQAAYRLRARLDGEKFQAAFGPGLDSLDHLRTKNKATQGGE